MPPSRKRGISSAMTASSSGQTPAGQLTSAAMPSVWKLCSAPPTARFDSFTRGRFAHPAEDRNITLREGARLQTFPDDFRFAGNQEDIAAQIGNAVPPALAEVIAGAIRRHLNGDVVESLRRGGSSRPRARTTAQIALFGRGEQAE